MPSFSSYDKVDAVHQASVIAQCCVSGINVTVYRASLWFNAVHPQLNDVHQASVQFNAVCQASIWLNMP